MTLMRDWVFVFFFFFFQAEDGIRDYKVTEVQTCALPICLIDSLSARFGSQCVVVGIDSQLTEHGYRAYQFTGDPQRTREAGRDVLAWVGEAQRRGAGEIVLNCMGSDGVRRGYDVEQLRDRKSTRLNSSHLV